MSKGKVTGRVVVKSSTISFKLANEITIIGQRANESVQNVWQSLDQINRTTLPIIDEIMGYDFNW